MSCSLAATLDGRNHVISKRLARIHDPKKTKIMIKNDYKKDKLKKTPKKDH